MRKLAKIEPRKPDLVEPTTDDLLIFDARILDWNARRELQRVLPGLVHAGRYWAARFAKKGCLCCHRKKVPYGSGGLCERCRAREYDGIRGWYSKRFASRDLDKEVNALSLRFDVAQMLFNGAVK
jgi:hypothetical protein